MLNLPFHEISWLHSCTCMVSCGCCVIVMCLLCLYCFSIDKRTVVVYHLPFMIDIQMVITLKCQFPYHAIIAILLVYIDGDL